MIIGRHTVHRVNRRGMRDTDDDIAPLLVVFPHQEKVPGVGESSASSAGLVASGMRVELEGRCSGMGWRGWDGCLSRNRGTLSLRRSLIINSYLYDLLLFAQPRPAVHPLSSSPPRASHPWPWSSELSLSVRLQISFLCRLIKLV